HVAPWDLRLAEERASGIFRHAKVTINWELIPKGDAQGQQRSEPWNPADLHLRLWTRAAIGSNTFSDWTLGFCLSKEQSTAVVLADEIQRRAEADSSNPGDLLGLVMAHEIGHLLLPSPVHSDEGIMQARVPTGLSDRRRMLLAFSRQQAALFRSEVGRRAGAGK
ncbi:MAG: hypothetical protein ABI822_28900, partial [Bryobacteraceae bacterium]